MVISYVISLEAHITELAGYFTEDIKTNAAATNNNNKVTIIPIVIGTFGTVTKGLLKGLEDL